MGLKVVFIKFWNILDNELNINMLKTVFPEDILVLDHYLFVDSKFQSWTNFDMLKVSHDFTISRIEYLCTLIKNNKLFKVKI